jgi:hypothetical protein
MEELRWVEHSGASKLISGDGGDDAKFLPAAVRKKLNIKGQMMMMLLIFISINIIFLKK